LLKPGREATIIEQVAIFIYMVGHQSSNWEAQERFQHSGQTISMYISFPLLLTIYKFWNTSILTFESLLIVDISTVFWMQCYPSTR
jgi:hypothetical protein